MYGLSNGENIFDLRWPLKVNGQGQTLKKIEEHFYSSLPLTYTFKTPTKNKTKNS